MNPTDLTIRIANETYVPLIITFIKELGAFENLEVAVTESILNQSQFEKKTAVEVILAYYGVEPVAFALFLQKFSTFLGATRNLFGGLICQTTYARSWVWEKKLSYILPNWQ